MFASAARSATAVWLLLLLATWLSYALCHDAAPGLDARIAGAGVIAIAFVKARMIGLHFMDLRGAIWPLRLFFEAWILIVCIVLLVLFWQAR